MGDHRLCVHFDPERADDPSWWRAWVEGVSPELGRVATMGERRPLIAVAAPYPGRNGLDSTRREQEAAGLVLARALLDEAQRVAVATRRTVAVLLSGRLLGRVSTAGELDEGIVRAIDEWAQKVAARPPEEPEWERDGWASVWAGNLEADELDALFEEQYEHEDRPLSPFARALRIRFYDHDFLEYTRVNMPTDLVSVVRQLSFAPSFVERIPEAMCKRVVNCAAILYDTDFTQRPRNAARGRLFFVGAFPFHTESDGSGDA